MEEIELWMLGNGHGQLFTPQNKIWIRCYDDNHAVRRIKDTRILHPDIPLRFDWPVILFEDYLYPDPEWDHLSGR